MATITGTVVADVLYGTSGNDVISGLDGDDLIFELLGGLDTIYGGAGRDIITIARSSNAVATIDGGNGDDRIFAGTVSTSTGSRHQITTGTGSDVVLGAGQLEIYDFTPGNGGDRIDLGVLLAGASGWDQASNPFGGVPFARILTVSGTNTVIQYRLNPAADSSWRDYAYLANVRADQFTAFNLSGYSADGSAPTPLSLTGTSSDDWLNGLGGNDTIDGGDGNDRIFAGTGNDNVNGGDGDDIIDGEGGSDMLAGGRGNDTLTDHYGYAGTLDGGEGNDTLNVDLQYSSFVQPAQTGLQPVSYARTLLGGDGNDTIQFRGRTAATFTVDGGTGDDDILYFGGGTATIRGGDGNDRIRTQQVATIDAGAGDDLVIVGNGVSQITLGPGRDTVQLYQIVVEGAAPHVVDFQAGLGGDIFDIASMVELALNPGFSNGEGNPVRLIQRGNNVFVTAGLVIENTTIAALTADNFNGFATDGSRPAGATLQGDSGDNVLTGTVGDDVLNGGDGDDTLSGGFNHDILTGGAGNDYLDGGVGSDELYGGDGDDILIDSTFSPIGSAAILMGGAGNDHITASGALQQVVLTVDGGSGDDVINITGGRGTIRGGDGDDDVTLTNIGNGVVSIDLGAGNDILRPVNVIATGGQSALTLGAGQDRVLITETSSRFTILDFQTGEAGDQIDVSRLNYPGSALTFTQTGADVYIAVNSTTLYILRNVDGTELSPYNLNYQTAFYNPPARNFQGTAGADTYVSADGNDTISGGDGDDVLYGAGGDDVIDGGAGNDTLFGGSGNDTLFGGTGIDRLVGGAGNDQLWVDNPGDVVEEAAEGGNDVVYATVSYTLAQGQEVEVLSTGSNAGTGAIDLTGNEFANILYGNAGTNTLRGGGGSGDLLIGLGGDDTYYVQGDERVFEAAGGGRDVVYASASYVLAQGQEIEVLSTTSNAGTAAIDLTGNEFANVIFGNAGTNTLRGGGGSGDLLVGLGGDDTYYVQGDERVFEAAGGGRDVVYASASYVLAQGQEIEVLSTTSNAGTAAIDLTGNEFANILYGNAGTNTLRGGGGSGDLLVGFGGDDTYYVQGDERVFEDAGGGRDVVYASASYVLTQGQEIEVLSTTSNAGTAAINLTGNEFANIIFGNNGANNINGGAGSDTLVGFGGSDLFIFNTALGSGNVDVLADFVRGSDKIGLDDAIFAGLLPGPEGVSGHFAIGAAVDADDRIIYDQTTGALYYDADGNGSGAAVQFATVTGAPPLTAGDFFVI